MTPPGALGPTLVRFYLALLRVHRRDGRATTRTVAAEAGRGVSTTHRALRLLVAEGLVAWPEGTRGTLRPVYCPTGTNVWGDCYGARS